MEMSACHSTMHKFLVSSDSKRRLTTAELAFYNTVDYSVNFVNENENSSISLMKLLKVGRLVLCEVRQYWNSRILEILSDL